MSEDAFRRWTGLVAIAAGIIGGFCIDLGWSVGGGALLIFCGLIIIALAGDDK